MSPALISGRVWNTKWTLSQQRSNIYHLLQQLTNRPAAFWYTHKTGRYTCEELLEMGHGFMLWAYLMHGIVVPKNYEPIKSNDPRRVYFSYCG
jgi:hypothetical protein